MWFTFFWVSKRGCLSFPHLVVYLCLLVMVLSKKTLLVLQVITVEPGCYFIEPLLEDALQDPAKSEFLVKQVLEKFRRLGGVRLEDNVVGHSQWNCCSFFPTFPWQCACLYDGIVVYCSILWSCTIHFGSLTDQLPPMTVNRMMSWSLLILSLLSEEKFYTSSCIPQSNNYEIDSWEVWHTPLEAHHLTVVFSHCTTSAFVIMMSMEISQFSWVIFSHCTTTAQWWLYLLHSTAGAHSGWLWELDKVSTGDSRSGSSHGWRGMAFIEEGSIMHTLSLVMMVAKRGLPFEENAQSIGNSTREKCCSKIQTTHIKYRSKSLGAHSTISQAFFVHACVVVCDCIPCLFPKFSS